MHLAIPIILIILLLVIGGAVVGTVANLLWFLIVGVIVGALARLVLPGDQNMGFLATALYGIAGALLGGIVADWAELGTILSLVISVAVAAVLIALFGSMGRNRHDRDLTV